MVDQSDDLGEWMLYLIFVVKLPELGERFCHCKVDCSIVSGYSLVDP